jgi:Tfp pilus assembly protein PilF
LPPTSLPHGCPLPFVSAGRAYLQMNEPGRAEAHLQAALALDPRCAAAHLDLGQVGRHRREL